MNNEFNLDFSGGPKSWFDFWHTHIDWEGKGNECWEIRESFLKQLIDLFGDFKLKLKDYPNDFQLWILIDENESGEDGIYIHTKNPNSDNFPFSVNTDKRNTILNNDLKRFVDSLNFERVRIETEDGSFYYFYEKGTGVSLV